MKINSLGIVGLISICVALTAYLSSSMVTPPQYVSVLVKRGRIQPEFIATGTVEPEHRLDVKASLEGRLDQVLVRPGDRVQKGQTLAWMSSSERAVILDSARSQGASEYEKWKDIYRPTPILASSSGLVLTRRVEPGQTVASGEILLTLADRLVVAADVDERKLSKIRPNQKVDLIFEAMGVERKKGRVEKVAFEGKMTEKGIFYSVTIIPEAVSEFLRIGMSAKVQFEINSKADAILIPTEAIQTKNGSKHIFIRSKITGEMERRQVEVGEKDDKLTEVISGLEVGETILIRGDPTKMVKDVEDHFSNTKPDPAIQRSYERKAEGSGRNPDSSY